MKLGIQRIMKTMLIIAQKIPTCFFQNFGENREDHPHCDSGSEWSDRRNGLDGFGEDR
jgi:hypothetical protein